MFPPKEKKEKRARIYYDSQKRIVRVQIGGKAALIHWGEEENYNIEYWNCLILTLCNLRGVGNDTIYGGRHKIDWVLVQLIKRYAQKKITKKIQGQSPKVYVNGLEVTQITNHSPQDTVVFELPAGKDSSAEPYKNNNNFRYSITFTDGLGNKTTTMNLKGPSI